MVDEISEMVPGKTITATKTLSETEDLFRDHFPGFPVVPGVLLTEMMAQAAGKCLFAENPSRGRPMLAQIKAANFRGWVRPGETVVLTAKILSSRLQFATSACQGRVDGRLVCTAEVMFTFAPSSTFAADYRDEVLDHYLAGQSSAPPNGQDLTDAT